MSFTKLCNKVEHTFDILNKKEDSGIHTYDYESHDETILEKKSSKKNTNMLPVVTLLWEDYEWF